MKVQRLVFGIAAAFAFVAATLAASGSAQAVDLAKVNGKAITDADLKKALSNLNEGQRQGVLKDLTTRRQVLSGVIEQEILVQEGEKSKFDQEKEYKDALDAFRRQYLASKVLQKNVGGKFTDKEAKKWYDGHKERYSTDQVHVMHILVRDESEARDVYEKAKALDNDKFQELAEKVSKDPSAKNNRGDLGFFGRDRMVAEFNDAAFAGEVGKVTHPVKTAYGYHIIKVIEKKPGQPLEYDEVEARVKNDLRAHLTQNYVTGLRKTAKVELDEKALDKL